MVGGADSCNYATLSYCWGYIPKAKRELLNTSSNIASRLSGISMDELPKTLQHAVWTVRALGISYIWIDALCIIQDDLNDWTKEASRMGHTYQQSCVTTAATTSNSSFDGFLHDRGPCFSVASTLSSRSSSRTTQRRWKKYWAPFISDTHLKQVLQRICSHAIGKGEAGRCKKSCYPREFCTLQRTLFL